MMKNSLENSDFLNECEVIKVDHNNDDLLIVNAARVSMNKRKDIFDESDKSLLQYLYKHDHFSPFSHPKIVKVVITPHNIYNRLYADSINRRYDGRTIINLGSSKTHQFNLEVSSVYSELRHEKYPDQMGIRTLMDNFKNTLFTAKENIVQYTQHKIFYDFIVLHVIINSNIDRLYYDNRLKDIKFKEYVKGVQINKILEIDYTHLVNKDLNTVKKYISEDIIFKNVLSLDDNDLTVIAKSICHLTLLIKAPMPIRTQLYRSEYGFSKNEISRRYVEDDVKMFLPKEFRGKPENSVKQGSSDTIIDIDKDESIEFLNNCYKYYLRLLKAGVSVEQARMFLPQATITEFYFTASYHNYDRLLNLRSDDKVHPQYDTRLLCDKIKKIMYGDGSSGNWREDNNIIEFIHRKNKNIK